MSVARKVVDHLTPEARVERAKRRLADDIDELVEAKLAKSAAGGEWVDQKTSPLGRKKHLRLARQGKFPSKKEGRQVLVRRDDLNAYLERHGIARGTRNEDDDVEDILDTITKGGKR